MKIKLLITEEIEKIWIEEIPNILKNCTDESEAYQEIEKFLSSKGFYLEDYWDYGMICQPQPKTWVGWYTGPGASPNEDFHIFVGWWKNDSEDNPSEPWEDWDGWNIREEDGRLIIRRNSAFK